MPKVQSWGGRARHWQLPNSSELLVMQQATVAYAHCKASEVLNKIVKLWRPHKDKGLSVYQTARTAKGQ